MRSAHPVAVIALYAVCACGVLALVLEALHWWGRLFPRRPLSQPHTGEYDLDALRRHARQRAAEYHAKRTGGAA